MGTTKVPSSLGSVSMGSLNTFERQKIEEDSDSDPDTINFLPQEKQDFFIDLPKEKNKRKKK